MPSRTIIRKAISILLILAGSGLEFSSCSREILRNGNEPIASMIALVGLYAIVAGWVGWRTNGERMTERQRVRLRLLFEHLVYCVAFGAWWLIIERETFFTDTPFGEDILALQRLLLAVFIIVGVFSAVLLTALRTPASRDRMRPLFPVSAPTWQALAVGFLVLTVLNVVQGEETLRVGDGLRVSIISRGFPLPAVQRIQVAEIEGAERRQRNQHTETLILPNGTAVRFAEGTITVDRYGRPPRHLEEGVSSVRLSDGKVIDFEDDGIIVSLDRRRTIVLNLKESTAAFMGGGTVRNDIRANAINVLIGLFLTIHLAVCVERIQRVELEPR